MVFWQLCVLFVVLSSAVATSSLAPPTSPIAGDTAVAPGAGAAVAGASVDIPVLPADDPCVAKCDFPGGWKTSTCQDCVLRGLVNGWVARSGGERGYNYAEWSRDFCLRYAAGLQHEQRLSHSASLSFAKCFFDEMHMACNT